MSFKRGIANKKVDKINEDDRYAWTHDRIDEDDTMSEFVLIDFCMDNNIAPSKMGKLVVLKPVYMNVNIMSLIEEEYCDSQYIYYPENVRAKLGELEQLIRDEKIIVEWQIYAEPSDNLLSELDKKWQREMYARGKVERI